MKGRIVSLIINDAFPQSCGRNIVFVSYSDNEGKSSSVNENIKDHDKINIIFFSSYFYKQLH